MSELNFVFMLSIFPDFEIVDSDVPFKMNQDGTGTGFTIGHGSIILERYSLLEQRLD